jgi:hypothetical protein
MKNLQLQTKEQGGLRMKKLSANIGDIVRLSTPNDYKFIGRVEYIKVTTIENDRYSGNPVDSNGELLYGDNLHVGIPDTNKWMEVTRG